MPIPVQKIIEQAYGLYPKGISHSSPEYRHSSEHTHLLESLYANRVVERWAKVVSGLQKNFSITDESMVVWYRPCLQINVQFDSHILKLYQSVLLPYYTFTVREKYQHTFNMNSIPDYEKPFMIRMAPLLRSRSQLPRSPELIENFGFVAEARAIIAQYGAEFGLTVDEFNRLSLVKYIENSTAESTVSKHYWNKNPAETEQAIQVIGTQVSRYYGSNLLPKSTATLIVPELSVPCQTRNGTGATLLNLFWGLNSERSSF